MINNNKKESKGVNTVLTTSIAVFILIMVLVLWLGYMFFMDDIYRLVKEHEMKSAADDVLDLVKKQELDGKTAKAIGEEYGVCIEVCKINGTTSRRLVSADVIAHCAIHNTDTKSKFSIYDSAMKNGGVYLEYFLYDQDTGDFYSIREDEITPGNELSLIYALTNGEILMLFNSTVSPISATVRTFYLLLGAFTIIILLLTLVFTNVLSGFITKPLESLTEATKRFGQGELDANFRVSGYTEAEQLSGAIAYAADELKKTEQLRRDLLANVSHDLRTPITLIMGYAEMMRDIPGENTPENLDNIVSEASRLSSMVSDVLDYSKLISGTLPFKETRFSLTEKVSEICLRYSELLKKDGYTLDFSGGQEMFVIADPDQITRVLINFLSNAVVHSGDSKEITVAQSFEDGGVKISVTDKGDGICANELSGIWERYNKASTNRVRSSGSSGLGLSIVKAIIERSGGAYGVDSTVGVGSTFWFWLPIENRHA